MKIEETGIEGVKVLLPSIHKDNRGFFMETFSERMLPEIGLKSRMVQDNHSLSHKAGTIRGLHYQLEPGSQTKIIRVISGKIMDVVVDIRKGSPTYGKWVSEILSSENCLQLVVPKGCAHGFCTLTEMTEVAYKVDHYYSPDLDRGIKWDDSEIGIEWPEMSAIVSEKDGSLPTLREAENNFNYTG